ncbi:DUF1616 domain-containing protein [Halosimplex salinum]|uniref:DUF1616 domain-containing protein n=1 Tax=Halosimplex salinum TaxID=1710538 RepID=UPI000F49D0DD|nr:DUF1616 domain-containing protein [Halosimplex salinum]
MDGQRGFDFGLWSLIPRPVRRLPADLSAVVLLVLLASLSAVLPVVSETPVRIVFGLPLVLFIPGYALVAALFPEASSEGSVSGEGETLTEGRGTANDGGIDLIERVALSFGLSIAVVPLIGLGLNFTPWGIRLGPILVGLGGFTLAATAVAARRRRDLPVDERFAVPYRTWFKSGYEELRYPDSRLDGALNIALVCSVLLASGSVAFAVAAPMQGESFTEFYLLTEDENGELVADDYPQELSVGESTELTVGIGNQENRQVSYTVVVAMQEVETDGNTTTVRQSRELQRFSPTLADNETWHQPHEITPTTSGTNLRLTYLLYEGDPGEDRSLDSAYRSNYIWINVTR